MVGRHLTKSPRCPTGIYLGTKGIVHQEDRTQNLSVPTGNTLQIYKFMRRNGQTHILRINTSPSAADGVSWWNICKAIEDLKNTTVKLFHLSIHTLLASKVPSHYCYTLSQLPKFVDSHSTVGWFCANPLSSLAISWLRLSLPLPWTTIIVF